MGQVLYSTENSANQSRVVTISLWDDENDAAKSYEEQRNKTRGIRQRNLRKLESYSKNIAQVSLETRLERKNR